MRKVLISILFLSSFSIHAFQNDPNSFRGIKFGASQKSLSEEYVLIDKDSYYKKNDKMKIGGAKLSFVGYYFYKDQFYSGTVITKGKNNKNALIDAFKSKFGKPTSIDSLGKLTWFGKSSIITIDCNLFTNVCNGVIQSILITRQLLADKKKEAEAGKDDF